LKENQMIPHTQAAAGYGTVTAPTRTARSAEYDVVARITARLKSASVAGPAAFPALAAAVHENRQLWSTLAADVALPDNPLPAGLRAQVFYLAEFTAQYSARVLSHGADVAPLVDINTAILRGLRGDGGQAA
jgi:flagellar protein FlaF